ncbi:MAG TPA: TetR/AcrR family transcriptional regulator [Solirubrobacteraceae bacterium]|nr:TetR/AcrR family transcriptional regulator [Solirubrobacteraceae bacterium]
MTDLSVSPPQRERALNAIVELVAREGYVDTTVAKITAASRLSRTTFYEHFRDKQDCFLAAQRQLAVRLRGEVERGVASGEPEWALASALAALVAFAEREPTAFHLVTHEAMIAGPCALDARDELMLAIEHTVEQALGAAPEAEAIVDIPTKLVLGGAVRLIGMSMRRTGGTPEPELVKLPGWLDCYSVPPGEARWRQVASIATVPPATNGPTRPIAPQPLPRGRHRISDRMVSAVQRERVLHATAEIVCAKGYAASTVADIAGAAGLSREMFYALFKDKRDAFLQAQQLVFEQMMAASAGAFFTSETTWPERIWEAMRTTTAWLLDQPTLAHFDFIEAYALGPSDAKRVDENVLAFNVFLEDGYRYRPQAAALPRLFAEAIAGSILELAAFYIRHGRTAETPGLLPLLTYVILAPFTGVREANELVALAM